MAGFELRICGNHHSMWNDLILLSNGLSPVRVLIGLHLHALYSKGLSKILTFNLMFKNADKSFKETHVREAVSSKSNIGYRIVGCKIDDLMSEKTINKR